MKHLPAILIFCSVSLFPIFSLAQNQSITGTFSTVGYYSGLRVVFNSDMTFTFKYHGHIYSDTAAGTYTFTGDTISLKYVYNNYDSILASYHKLNKEVPLAIQLDAGRVLLRPVVLLKRRLRLYVVDITTGKLKSYN
ncbi:MAG: hypothetical protein EOP48_02160 [Sphingobacteriales bacterium]|nr:MAG: hypothetical protein EOP48_02160 [Sphingobacteriales bacterium]